jgi:hypothetical protein
MTDGIIVCGPAGCGKSHNAEALRRHFGLSGVVHEWSGREALKHIRDMLVLTTADLSGLSYHGFRIVSFDDAMREAGLPNNYRHGRKWLPSEWMDEVPPQTGATPEQFLRRNPETGVLQLWPIDAAENYDDHNLAMARDLKDGDIVLFNWTEMRGFRSMTVKGGGAWTLDQAFAADANCFDNESSDFGVTSDLADIAKLAAETLSADDEVTVGVYGWTWSDDVAFRVRTFESGAAHFEPLAMDGPFQQRVAPWMQACFGPIISADTVERNDRFIEEALELIQACGGDRQRAHQLVDYVFDRPVGEKWQEAGGVMVTHAALCLAQGIDMHLAGERELLRIWTKVDAIRAKQAAKPTGSALPEYVSPPTACPLDASHG